MAIELTPWAIGGGALHSPEVARTLAYTATGGAEGVGSSTSLRVAALPVPGGAVTVAPGSAIIANRYPGGQFQSYIVRVPSQQTVTVTPTGSSGGRTDLIVARIVDPQYEGTPPADPNAFDYLRLTTIPNVPASADAAWLRANTAYPALALARITIPASTGTITSGMITEVRALTQARTHLGIWNPTLSSGRLNLSTSVWTDVHVTTTTIPEWATRADITLLVNDMIVRDGYFQGEVRVAMSTTSGGNLRYTAPMTVTQDTDAPRGYRFPIVLGQFIEGIAGLAGQTAQIRVQMRAGTAPTNAYLENSNTTYSLKALFIEGAA